MFVFMYLVKKNHDMTFSVTYTYVPQPAVSSSFQKMRHLYYKMVHVGTISCQHNNRTKFYYQLLNLTTLEHAWKKGCIYLLRVRLCYDNISNLKLYTVLSTKSYTHTASYLQIYILHLGTDIMSRILLFIAMYEVPLSWCISELRISNMVFFIKITRQSSGDPSGLQGLARNLARGIPHSATQPFYRLLTSSELEDSLQVSPLAWLVQL